MWNIPPKQDAEFVARMEDVLTVYARAHDEKFPVVCMDEKPFQLVDERLEPIKMSTGNRTEKYDYQYERRGSCSIFMFTQPLAGWRHCNALPQRTSEDWANQIKWLLDEQYPDAEKIVLVMDNLNTHSASSLYKIFSPAEAFRLAQRLEIHYTPKHGSWLNIAEIELSALTIQCLGKTRIPSLETLNKKLLAWHTDRNAAQRGVDWHFSTDNARIKLKHLYPIVKI
ncbi:MAG: IS630 family transposase [Oscillospiraceae bacterium]|nr:IS630 family transposase [Oscillospiraceae bacterium]